MKKFLKYYLPLLIFLTASGIFLLGYMIENHAVVLKYIAGEAMEGKAKIIRTKVNAVVREDGIEQNRIKVFENDGKFYLVFEKTEDLGFGVLIVDKTRKDIFMPNVGSCYDLLFSKYLFQAECGRGGVPYSSGKADMYNVKLEANDSQINFQLPEYDYGKIKRNRKMEIIFKGE